MRKREWDRCKDPDKMIDAVGWWHSQPTHNRRLRIFTLTAGSAAIERYGDSACEQAVTLIWRLIDGFATVVEIIAVSESLQRTWQESLEHGYMEQARIVNILTLLLSDVENSPLSAARHLIKPIALANNQPFPC